MSNKIIENKIPFEIAEVVYNRISNLVEHYHRVKLIRSSSLNMISSEEFDIKTLCLSCYLQGLRDADQALQQAETEKQ